MDRYSTLDDVDVSGLAVLVRSDLDVPVQGGEVIDDSRIRAALPTLERLVEGGASVTVCAHLGWPDGPRPGFSLVPVVERMAEMTRYDVAFQSRGDITILENTRFMEGETTNRPETAQRLADGFDLFVQDAFAAVHHAHASTAGVAEMVRSVAGPLLDVELKGFGRFLGEAERPLTVVFGGSRLPDKLGAIRELLTRVDRVLIGGGLCFTFLVAKGHEVGRSLVHDDAIDVAGRLMSGPNGRKIILPVDVAIGEEFAEDTSREVVGVTDIPVDGLGLDIGPRTSAGFRELIQSSANVFWNGPMGFFEWKSFRHGTDHVARAMAACEGFTAVAGADTVSALRLLGLGDTVSHLSMAGGAALTMLEGRVLPGVAVLERWV